MKILLLSGGADSMLLNQRYDYDLKLFFDYGQEHLSKEFNCCSQYVDRRIKLNKFSRKGKEISCRNFTFIANVVSMYGDKELEIHLGTNLEDIYKDNSREFYDNYEDFINKISFNKVKIKTPLLKLSKKEILNELNQIYYTDD
jgi:7-cyano-7-deazaguanine synthase in queuosine biosynthesis